MGIIHVLFVIFLQEGLSLGFGKEMKIAEKSVYKPMGEPDQCSRKFLVGDEIMNSDDHPGRRKEHPG
jgi:hypothetical protein